MGQRADNQIIGVCRFSYLGQGGFSASQTAQETAAAELYDPERMRRRFAYFEHICLPSLAAQTDPDFTLIALIADTMPYRWRRRLKDLTASYPFLEVCTLEAAGPLNSTRRAFRRAWNQSATYITGFRIDDDDAVAQTYIARTREIADQMLEIGWADAETPAAICFHKGIYWDMNRTSGQFWDFTETQPLGLASAMITTPEGMANIYRWNHRRLAAHARCFIDPHEVMFVRTLHGHNDSDRTIPPGAIEMDEAKAKRLLRNRFGLAPQKIIPMMRDLQEDFEA